MPFAYLASSLRSHHGLFQIPYSKFPYRGRGGIGSRVDEAGPFLPASAAAGKQSALHIIFYNSGTSTLTTVAKSDITQTSMSNT